MAIGTTVKVGFDASAVKGGLSGMSNLFKGVFRGFRQVGIGAARQVGAGVTDLVGRAIMAIPSGMKEMMDWAGNLTDMGAQTGMSVSKIVVLEEALRMAGAEAADTSRIISTLADNLGEAMRETGPAQEALHRLGFKASEFKGIAIDEAFEKIGKRAGDMSWGVGELETTMADLFGARMGFKLIRFFRDFDGGMAEAEKNVGAFGNILNKSAPGFDRLSDALGRFKMKSFELFAVLADELVAMFGDDFVDKAFDWIDASKIRKTITYLREAIAGVFSGSAFSDMLKGFGRMIGDGIKESLGESFSLKSMVPKWMGGGGKETSSPTGSDKAIARMDRQIQLLQTIATKPTGWA